jgi:D-alanyl-D-alanine carboxypeptidase
MDKRTVDEVSHLINPESLADFIDQLRGAGYKIGVSQYIAAQELIIALIDRGENLDDPERLNTLLGPIFCSSPTEQNDFQQHFNRWISYLKFTRKLLKEASQTTNKIASKDIQFQSSPKKLRVIGSRINQLIKILVLAVILLPISPQRVQSPKLNPIPEPIQAPDGKPSPKPSISPPPENPKNTLPSSLSWQLILGLLLLTSFTVYLVWQFLLFRRDQLFLQRLGSIKEPELQKVLMQKIDRNWLPSDLLNSISKNLKQRNNLPSYKVNIDSTIERTLKQGGWLSPVYSTIQSPVEYLLLIERASFRDHQTKFIEEIIDYLKQDGVFITKYFFEDNPQICFGKYDMVSPKKINDIINQYHHHCLIIFADTNRFFSSINGAVEPWIEQLKSWDKRAILTPNPIGNWVQQEMELAQQFIVLPATLPGLYALGQILNPNVVKLNVLSEELKPPIPEQLITQPRRWIDRDPPEPEQIEAMLKLIEQYLGKAGYYWFAACSVFPELHWNITIYLGNLLKTEAGLSIIDACTPGRLARLPWFRYGYIPDWLRIRLISTLTNTQESTIRLALQELLVMSLSGYVNSQSLEIAKNQPYLRPKLISFVIRILTKIASENSPLRDYLFLRFMRKRSALAIKLPESLGRLLEKNTLSRSPLIFRVSGIASILSFQGSRLMSILRLYWQFYWKALYQRASIVLFLILIISILTFIIYNLSLLKSFKPFPTLSTTPISSAATLASVINCSTATNIVNELDRQILFVVQKDYPNSLVSLTAIDEVITEITDYTIPLLLQLPAKKALEQAVKKRGKKPVINSAYRSIARQKVLYDLRECYGSPIAPPGRSNHQTGLSIDIDDAEGWQPYLEAAGWLKLANDPPHFDFPESEPKAINVIYTKSFQRLWNLNNPQDKIPENGDYDSETDKRLGLSPVMGFPKGDKCGIECGFEFP